MPEEKFTRRNLPPHWYMPAATHFITFRLATAQRKSNAPVVIF